MAALLLERGTDITVDPFVSSPPTSCMCTCVIIMTDFIQMYSSILVMACIHNHIETVKLLLKHGFRDTVSAIYLHTYSIHIAYTIIIPLSYSNIIVER